MKQLNKHEIQKLNTLNQQFIDIEQTIYDVAYERIQATELELSKNENNIIDYETEVVYYFYACAENDEDISDEPLAEFEAHLNLEVMKNDWCGLNDKKCHNTTSVYQKDEDLNTQKHCWLLHSLYDNYSLDWDDIFKIKRIFFDVKVQYEYAVNIK
ncbi:hypothetical protein [Sulfurimonas sp.]|uniref:hypothetical protein n=1 Tax=Sulfurimonas sp. TaxID=2022749 RepID=UPI003568FC52